ncbi:unnamed protein product [Brachionus calyciflorus]|uniref:CSN12-like protein n=1 Tax=Brachionus calyciflorus TaxID=104777 RepID=A0A813SJP2_9BILA|nr:unnamed protein product [Brachionus calyciflorus]
MNISPNRFIDEIFRSLMTKDALSLAKLLSFKNHQYRSIYFSDESLRYLTDKFKNSPNEIYNWSEAINYYILSRNSIYKQEYINAFDFLNKSFKCLVDLIKDAKDENWQLPVLFRMSVDLRLLASTCDTRQKQNYDDDQEKDANAEGSNNQDLYAEKTADALMASFRNLCTDTRSESHVSKRWGMMHIVNQLFKIYFKINKINLCNPLKRVIENSGLKDLFPRSHQIVYKFYVGRQAMFENDYNTAASYFEYAFQNCPNRYIKNKKIILVYLIPVNMLRGYMPKQDLLLKYDLKPFAEIVSAVKQGNIRKFNQDMIEYEDFFIDSGVYLFLEKLKMTTYRNLFKTLAKLLNTAQIPIEAFVNILKFLEEDDMDNDICQCILSNLIYEGKIKGYISHKHNKLVISRDFKVAFPRLSTINPV